MRLAGAVRAHARPSEREPELRLQCRPLLQALVVQRGGAPECGGDLQRDEGRGAVGAQARPSTQRGGAAAESASLPDGDRERRRRRHLRRSPHCLQGCNARAAVAVLRSRSGAARSPRDQRLHEQEQAPRHANGSDRAARVDVQGAARARRPLSLPGERRGDATQRTRFGPMFMFDPLLACAMGAARGAPTRVRLLDRTRNRTRNRNRTQSNAELVASCADAPARRRARSRRGSSLAIRASSARASAAYASRATTRTASRVS